MLTRELEVEHPTLMRPCHPLCTEAGDDAVDKFRISGATPYRPVLAQGWLFFAQCRAGGRWYTVRLFSGARR